MTAPDTVKKPLHFVQLDALRFLAAFMVVFSHAFGAWSGWFGIPKRFASATDPKKWSGFGEHLDKFVHNFNFGVDLFFLISGFLITYLLIREKSDKGKVNIPAFFLRRILRIWPLYFFIIALCFFWLVPWMMPEYPRLHLPYPEVAYKPVIFFYNNFDTIRTQTWNFPFAHFWSICIEEHFYLVWPFLVAFTPIKRLPIVLGIIILACMIFRAWAYYSLKECWFTLDLHTLARMDALAIGGLAAWRHYHHPFKLRVPLYLRILLLAILIGAMFFDDLTFFSNVFWVCCKRFFYLGLAGLLMMNFVFNPEAKFRWGPNHIFNYLGRCCFGIYLWGNILLQVIIVKVIVVPKRPIVDWMIDHIGPGLTYWSIIISFSLLIPVISYELIEKPFLKLKTRFAIVRTRV
jgi:peptidoglycan/LPS O-acetylase OafA/YrhL